MATFYILPHREILEHNLAEFVARFLPGLDAPPAVCDALVSALEFEANRKDDTYFVHREDLPNSGNLFVGLQETFGAESGDRIFELDAPASQSASTL